MRVLAAGAGDPEGGGEEGAGIAFESVRTHAGGRGAPRQVQQGTVRGRPPPGGPEQAVGGGLPVVAGVAGAGAQPPCVGREFQGAHARKASLSGRTGWAKPSPAAQRVDLGDGEVGETPHSLPWEPARWGVISTLSQSHNGWSGGSTSGSVTSRTARTRPVDGGVREGVLVDDRAAGGVQQYGAGAHGVDQCAVDEAAGGGQQRGVDAHDVAAREEFTERDRLGAECAGLLGGDVRVVQQDGQVVRAQQFDDAAADEGGGQDAHRAAVVADLVAVPRAGRGRCAWRGRRGRVPVPACR